MLLLIALFTGIAALDRLDRDGNDLGALLLGAVTLILVIGGVVQMVRDDA